MGWGAGGREGGWPNLCFRLIPKIVPFTCQLYTTLNLCRNPKAGNAAASVEVVEEEREQVEEGEEEEEEGGGSEEGENAGSIQTNTNGATGKPPPGLKLGLVPTRGGRRGVAKGKKSSL